MGSRATHRGRGDGPQSPEAQIYFREIESYPRLSREEEQTLARQIEKARCALFRAALSLHPIASELVKLLVKLGRGEIAPIRLIEGNVLEEQIREKTLARIAATVPTLAGLSGAVESVIGVLEQLPAEELRGATTMIRRRSRRRAKLLSELHIREDVVIGFITQYTGGTLEQQSLLSPGRQRRISAVLTRLIARTNRYRRRLVEGSLRYVPKFVRQYRRSGLPYLDLIQEGNRGLIRAAELFESKRGLRFATYASYWVRQLVRRAVADSVRVVRYPEGWLTKGRQVISAVEALHHELGRRPSPAEISARVEMEESEIEALLPLIKGMASLNAPIGNFDTELGDLILRADETELRSSNDASTLREAVMRALDVLKPREREILKLRFGIDCDRPHFLEEIAARFGVTREAIRQREASALEKLRLPTRAATLEDYA